MANEFWMSDRQWAVLEPLVPMNRRGVKPKRNREIISGIVHILKVGCRWRDCPEVYGPHTTIYNRFNRWSKAGIWQTMLKALVDPGSTGSHSIDSTTSKAHRYAAGGKGGPKSRRSGAAAAGGPPKFMPSPTPPGV
jgi:transposase